MKPDVAPEFTLYHRALIREAHILGIVSKKNRDLNHDGFD